MCLGPEDIKREAERYLRENFDQNVIQSYLERLRRVETVSEMSSQLPDKSKHCGVFVQIGMSQVQRRVVKYLEELGVRIMPLREALRELPEARKYYWKCVDFRENLYTALVAAYGDDVGLFIHVPSNVRLVMPLISCFLVPENEPLQLVHSVIVLEPGSELCLVKGCLTVPRSRNVAHISVEEVYIGRESRYHVVMIHSWNETAEVRAITSLKLDQDSLSNVVYFTHTPVREASVSTRAVLEKSAQLTLNALIVGRGGGKYTVIDHVDLAGDYSSAMIVSRAAALDYCEISTISRIEARGAGARGHIECTAVPLTEKVKISTVPELIAHRDDVQLTHEAAIGRLSEEELTYLLMRGLSEEEAKSLLVLGALRVEMPGLPESIRGLINKTIREVFRRGLM